MTLVCFNWVVSAEALLVGIYVAVKIALANRTNPNFLFFIVHRPPKVAKS